MTDELKILEDDLDDIDLTMILQDWVRESDGAEAETQWRTESKEDYKFYAGEQDDQQNLNKLRSDNRPTTVFNEIKTKIDTLIGLSRQLKLNPTIYPVGMEDEQLAEAMGETLKHFRRELGIEKIENDCASHMIKSGRSLQGFWIDSSNPFDHKIKSVRVEGGDFLLDPLSKDYPGMTDARYLFVNKWMELDQLRGIVQSQEIFDRVRNELVPANSSTSDLAFYDSSSRKVRVFEAWYRVWSRVIWFINPITGQVEHLKPADFEKFRSELLKGVEIDGPDGEKMFFQSQFPLEGFERRVKKIKYAIFAGNQVIERGDNPFQGFNEDRFPYTLYGAYKDDNLNKWFGAIKAMKDPQKGLNTIMRQLIHLLQTSPKGILLYELGTIPNIEDYRRNSSKANFAMAVKKGAITEQRIKFTDQPQIPNIYERLLDVYEQMMKNVSGVRDALLGISVGSREPGITMQLRQQSGLAALTELFENYKDSRVHATRQLLSLIQQFVSPNTVFRIFPQGQLLIINGLSPDGSIINDISTPKFDLFVDEGVEGETMRLANAKILSDFAQNNPGVIPPDVLMDQTGLSWSAKQRVREFSQQARESQASAQQEQMTLEWAKIAVQGRLRPTAENIEALKKEASKTRDQVTKEK